MLFIQQYYGIKISINFPFRKLFYISRDNAEENYTKSSIIYSFTNICNQILFFPYHNINALNSSKLQNLHFILARNGFSFIIEKNKTFDIQILKSAEYEKNYFKDILRTSFEISKAQSED